MEYSELLKNLKECPFCNLTKEEIILQNKFGKIILARAPYYKDHILIIPNKHATKISDLTNKELIELHKLQVLGVRFVSKKHKDFSILYREGKKAGKSVEHFHINIIPQKVLRVQKAKVEDRYVYSKKEYHELTKKAKSEI